MQESLLRGLMVSPAAVAPSEVLSVTLSSEGTVRIKPCEPLWVLLRITVASSRAEGAIQEPPFDLIRRATINDTEYQGQFNANPVAMFVVDRSSAKQLNDDVKSVRVMVLLFWNIEDRSYVFKDPGRYRVQFHPGAEVEVIVERPSSEEEKIIAQISERPGEFADFVLNPGNLRQRALAPRIEKILADCPDTSYTPYLAIALGIYKFTMERPEPGGDIETYVAERAKVKQYFEPYCQGEIKSFFQTTATYHLGLLESEQCRAPRDRGSAEAQAACRHASELLEKVKASPYASDLRLQADTELRRLQKTQSASWERNVAKP